MCLTIIYGAYELLGSSRTRTKAPPKRVNPAADLNSFVTEVSQKLAGEKIATEYQYLIAQAGTPWAKDPFLQSTKALKPSLVAEVLSAAAVQKQEPPDFAYTGYLAIGAVKLALINGIEYSEGEALPIDDYFIKTINPNRVVIARIDGTETIQLPIQDMESGLDN